jgi:hypothetical protein
MKTQMLLLLQHVLDDIESRCCVSTRSDMNYIRSRVDTEGVSFLTITLADFGKDFEKSLDQGFVHPDSFRGFKLDKKLPTLLGGLLDGCFDRETGLLLEDVNTEFVQAFRQITLMWAKMNLPCTPAREAKALKQFLETEREMLYGMTLSSQEIADFQRHFSFLFSDVLRQMEKDLVDGEFFTPRHGPGATADKLYGNAKFDQAEWTDRLEQVFSVSDYLIPNYTFWEDVQSVAFRSPGEERPVKVTLVPKTLKTPRIIAIEPTCMQYMQQAISMRMVTLLEKNDSFASGMIGFSDQVPNQDLARKGSLDGSLSTIDLSEASDRVPNWLVIKAFKPWPRLSEAIQAVRSTRADVDGLIVSLTKYASMGSALCFPIEAMVFLTLIHVGIAKEQGTTIVRANPKKGMAGKVRVYGDDLIVPAEYTRSVIQTLEAFGFKVNSSKSFWTGKFRESCGKEFYAGDDVSIVKLRRPLPESLTDVDSLVSAVAMRNLLYWAGYFRSVEYLDGILHKILKYFPYVEATSSILGRETLNKYQIDKSHADHHSPLVRGWKVVAKPPHNSVDGVGALQKFFLKQGLEPFADAKHLERSGRPRAVNIKLGYGSPF